ncbi:MAG: hypothetical protein N3E49_02265 [Bacteroidia bacterium]|nr:hypothetical protein [Bacteroidia bacterium]
MRRKGWAILLLSLLLAQSPHRVRERLQSMRIAYLSNEMQLMPEEAQTFWPLYNAREAELQKVRSIAREQLKRLREKQPVLSAEAYADSVSLIYLGLWRREAEIRQSFHDRFKKCLPPEKLARFYLAELFLLRRAWGEEVALPRE